jgi:hypothetical protein
LKPKPVQPLPRSLKMKASGPVQVVFDWTTSRCEDLDIPDVPARAFRGADGRVQLIAAHFINRRFTGPDLDHLTHDCSVILGSDFNADPAAYDDHDRWFPGGRHGSDQRFLMTRQRQRRPIAELALLDPGDDHGHVALPRRTHRFGDLRRIVAPYPCVPDQLHARIAGRFEVLQPDRMP